MKKILNKNKKGTRMPKYRTEEQEQIIKFIVILLIVIAFVVGAYFFTKSVVKKDSGTTEEQASTAGAINYDVVTVGTMFNKSDSSYYVIVYNSEDTSTVYYQELVSKYSKTTNALKVYTCDLNNSLNTKYVASDEKPENIKAKTIYDVSFGKLTLVKIKNGKIIKYINNIDSIKTELGS